jgi:hypothetical protein
MGLLALFECARYVSCASAITGMARSPSNPSCPLRHKAPPRLNFSDLPVPTMQEHPTYL